MTGNTFGEHFRLTTFGESHGEAVGGIIDGCPAGVAVDFAQIDSELSRRRGDGIEGSTSRKECDQVEWLSGILDGVTLGTPIAFLVRNRDTRSDDYEQLKEWQRAGHADYTYEAKYGCRDHRGGGRASARETVARVVAGAIARQLLAAKGITIASEAECQDSQDGARHEAMPGTVGGTVRCSVYGLRPGVGEPVFNKLGARLAYAAMSIPSAVSFEMGAGREATAMSGNDYADRWLPDNGQQPAAATITNHCGGVQGGISNGMPVEFTVGFHPVVTQIPLTQCRNKEGKVQMIEIKGRHDRCHVPRAAVIVEAMTAITLTDFLLGTENN